MACIGIDLGTTYSVIAKLTGDIVEVLPNEEGLLLTPSVVYIPEGSIADAIAGDIACSMLNSREQNNVIRWTKRLMGTDHKIKIKKQEGEIVEFTPTEISSVTLRKLKADAATIMGEPVEGAVITVPAWFGIKECEEVMKAGELADIKVLQLLPEPQAAAIDYSIDQNIDLHGKKIFVYDLGGGTFDATLIQVECEVKDDGRRLFTFVELAKEGSRELGGYDWDKELIKFVCEKFDQKHDTDSRLETRHDLEVDAEKVKKALSKVNKAFFNISVEDIVDAVEVTREQFEDVTKHLVEQTRTKIRQTMENASLGWNDIDYVLMVGGSTNMPMIKNMLEEELGEENIQKLLKHKGVDFNVARGAAYVAGDFIRVDQGGEPINMEEYDYDSLTGEDVDFVQLSNIVVKRNLKEEDAIGVTGLKNGQVVNAIILPAESSTDEEHKRTFPLAEDNMTEVTIVINRGNSEDINKVEKDKGRVILSGLPEGRPAGCMVEVAMKLDNNGMLSGKAKDIQTGTECEISIQLDPIV